MKLLQQLLDGLDKGYPQAGYAVAEIPAYENHKIGLNEWGCPIFFFQSDSSNSKRNLPYHLEMIDINFERRCELREENGEIHNGHYSTIELKDGYQQLEGYYLEIVYLLLVSLPAQFTTGELRTEIGKIIDLFTAISSTPSKSIQGLWAELFVIEQALDPAYLIRCWHRDIFDVFDFNDGEIKLEVKSTSRKLRIHTFSIDQLRPNEHAILFIASVMVLPTGLGYNIFDLKEKILSKLLLTEDKMKLHSMISLTLGNNLLQAEDHYFDYGYSKDKLFFFDYRLVPCISRDHIPSEISEVSFKVNLSAIEDFASKKLTGKLGCAFG